MGLAERVSMVTAARWMRRSYNSVKGKADELGLSFKQGRLQLKDVAEIIGVHPKTIQARRDKLGLKFRTGSHNGASNMRGPKGADIVAIARDILDDPPYRGLPNTSQRTKNIRLGHGIRQVIQDYEGWEG